MMPAYYALYAQAYMAKHGLTHDDLMSVRIKASTYGVINERAVYRKPVKPEDFKQGDPEAKLAGPVAWPLRVGDCCANADGSSCIILVVLIKLSEKFLELLDFHTNHYFFKSLNLLSIFTTALLTSAILLPPVQIILPLPKRRNVTFGLSIL